MIFSCSYLYFLSYRACVSIPTIETKQKKDHSKQNLKLKKYNKFTNNLLRNLPFVSIIVPVRNEEKYIERCLLSLLSQDYPQFELIVIDDNSSDNTLKIMKDIKNSSYYKTNGFPIDKLKIISLKDKPENWTGKTWASQQGYIESRGKVLLFTDGDTNYVSRDVISQTVLYMQKEQLDVLTGTPSSEKLINFWSKITVPFWAFVIALFGINNSKVNNPKSKIAYLMGCFFLIKRNIFVDIGTFESVHDALLEDKALGVLVKKRGHKMKIVKLGEMVYTLWLDGLIALWYGIGRTLAPLVMKNRFKIIINLCIIFFATILPFVLFPITLTIAFEKLSFVSIFEIPFCFYFYSLLLNLLPCIIVLYLYSLKCKEFGITPLYSFWSLFASIFVIVACLYNITPLLVFGKTRPILWQGRHYTYNKEQEGFTI